MGFFDQIIASIEQFIRGVEREPEISDPFETGIIADFFDFVESILPPPIQIPEAEPTIFEPEFEPEPITFYKHFVADIKYNRGFFAVSYTLEQEDIESDLVDELRSSTGITNEGYLDSFGYSREEFEGDPPFLYPEVEVGQE